MTEDEDVAWRTKLVKLVANVRLVLSSGFLVQRTAANKFLVSKLTVVDKAGLHEIVSELYYASSREPDMNKFVDELLHRLIVVVACI